MNKFIVDDILAENKFTLTTCRSERFLQHNVFRHREKYESRALLCFRKSVIFVFHGDNKVNKRRKQGFYVFDTNLQYIDILVATLQKVKNTPESPYVASYVTSKAVHDKINQLL
jgi:hypothetical protein